MNKECGYIHVMEYYSARKRGNPAICNNMDEPGKYYVMRIKACNSGTNTTWFHLQVFKIVKLIEAKNTQ